jgi:hypothetical protein
MQLDPAPGPGEPFLHQLGVMIARVVKKDMDVRQHRKERLDRFQEPDRRDGVDGYDLDHPGLSGREVDRAVNIDPLAPARLFDSDLLLFGLLIVSGLDKRLESILVENSPQWLTDLTTRF